MYEFLFASRVNFEVMTCSVHVLHVRRCIIRLQRNSACLYFRYPKGSKHFYVKFKKFCMQLTLVMQATNATSERSFSALRRVKTYLRTTMSQQRLNHLMLLHVHKDRTDKLNLNLKTILNVFVQSSQHRTSLFLCFK